MGDRYYDDFVILNEREFVGSGICSARKLSEVTDRWRDYIVYPTDNFDDFPTSSTITTTTFMDFNYSGSALSNDCAYCPNMLDHSFCRLMLLSNVNGKASINEKIDSSKRENIVFLMSALYWVHAPSIDIRRITIRGEFHYLTDGESWYRPILTKDETGMRSFTSKVKSQYVVNIPTLNNMDLSTIKKEIGKVC